MKTALVAGATGLIGKQLLDLLLEEPLYEQVKVIVRRPMSILHPKLQSIVANFNDLNANASDLRADDVFCALGTTMKKAGSKEAFEKVDLRYPLELAGIARAQGAKQFLLVTAMGASKNSSVYYNRVKGLVEEGISKLEFESFHIFRPSLLLGPREEERAGEEIAKKLTRWFGFLLPEKYKAIDSAKVAKAMVRHAAGERTGVHIHESEEMQDF